MCDTSGRVGGSVCAAQHAAALDSGFSECAWHFSSPSASPGLISGYNRVSPEHLLPAAHAHARPPPDPAEIPQIRLNLPRQSSTESKGRARWARVTNVYVLQSGSCFFLNHHFRVRPTAACSGLLQYLTSLRGHLLTSGQL